MATYSPATHQPPSMEEIILCARLAKDAYEPRGELKRKYNTHDFIFCTWLENPKHIWFQNPELRSTQGFVVFCRRNRSLYCVFRGTESISDLITDLDLRWKNSSGYNPSLPLSEDFLGEVSSIKVHSGFLQAFLSIKRILPIPHYHEDTLEYPDRGQLWMPNWDYSDDSAVAIHPIFLQAAHVFITGHSLGGALANLAFVLLAERSRRVAEATGASTKISLLTFGAPPVGNTAFKHYLEEKVAKDHLHSTACRILGRGDTVPQVSQWFTDWVHAGDSLCLRDERLNSTLHPLQNHSIETYLKVVETRPAQGSGYEFKSASSSFLIRTAVTAEASELREAETELLGQLEAARVPLGKKVSVLARANNHFVCAESAGEENLKANRGAVGKWEQFELNSAGNGEVALRALVNGQYVCAQDAGRGPLIANRNEVGLWERFEWINLGGADFALRAAANDLYVSASSERLVANSTGIGRSETFHWEPLLPSGSLRARANNHFVCAESAGEGNLKANRGAVGKWEQFELNNAGDGKIALRALVKWSVRVRAGRREWAPHCKPKRRGAVGEIRVDRSRRGRICAPGRCERSVCFCEQ